MNPEPVTGGEWPPLPAGWRTADSSTVPIPGHSHGGSSHTHTAPDSIRDRLAATRDLLAEVLTEGPWLDELEVGPVLVVPGLDEALMVGRDYDGDPADLRIDCYGWERVAAGRPRRDPVTRRRMVGTALEDVRIVEGEADAHPWTLTGIIIETLSLRGR